MATSLRPLAQQAPASQSQSPTSSTSSVTTTPTSPHFATHHRIQTSSATRVAINGNGNGNGSYHQSPAYAQSGSAVHARPGSSASVINHPRPPSPPLFRPPPDQTFASYLRTWGNGEIAQFLGVYNCGHHAPAFQRNDIDGKCLLDLDINTLKEIGIIKIGERIKVHNGIKELRKRAAGSRPPTALGASRVELRLNGAATPLLDDVPSLSPGLDELYARGGNASVPGLRRLGTARPPPLDLHPQGSRNNLPQAYQNAPASFSEAKSITPRPPVVKELAHPVPSRNGSSSSTASDATVVPGSHSLPLSQQGTSGSGSNLGASSSSVPAPAPSRPNNLNLRAPPARDVGRRSPSPVDADPTGFADRPLPPAPAQSSAAEYASSIRHHAEGRSTPTWGNEPHAQQHKPSAPSSERRHQPPPTIVRNDLSHRKNPSLGATPSGKPHSPIKTKFGNAPRANTSNGPVHPFAASRQDERERRGSPPDAQFSAGSIGGGLPGKAYRNTPYVIGTGGPGAIGRSASITTPTNASTFARRTDGQTPGTLSLEDLRKQLVKFISTEDGTMRTVNVSSCTSGVEVLERALKKFGKWGMGATASTDTESDEDGDRLEIDGWGVYEEQDPDDDSVPLSENALLNICVLHRDGVVLREHGLTLRRTRKPKYRKNMEEFLGETPPPPMSPTSPTYVAGPRLGITQRPDSELQTPSKPSAVKKMNRASMISVMSGLGVPGMNPPPSPTTAARSPSSGSFLAKSKRNYNFFGHRPSSELIADNVEHYFPSAKKRELEKTLRHSMLRMSMGPNAYRKSVASIAPSERVSLDSERRPSVEKTPPSRRPTSRTTSFAASPPTETIPEETEVLDNNVPRVAVTSEGSPMRLPRSSGESDRASLASVDSRPALLPPFEHGHSKTSNDAPHTTEGRPHLIQQHSMPGSSKPRPKSILQARRGSAGSSRSRMSMLSQLRKNRDRGDTASMLTVDEITAEVEHRRASTIFFDDESDEEVDRSSLRVPSMADPGVPTSGVEEEEEESEEYESSGFDEDDELEDEDEEDKDHGKAVFSTGSKSTIKWLKGALIGAGSFGSVFLGMNSLTGELMAVKQVELDVSARSEERTKGMIEALEREIELLKELQHDNIVQYLDSSTDDRYLNIFLEYVPGGSVAALLKKYGAFEEVLVKKFVRQILMGLQYLHERGVIHRDIKGANILVDNKAGVKISDFGISKKVESNLLDPQGQGKAKHRQSLQGSVFWMAPEVVKQTGHSSKADIWSVGCLVVEMLTGTHPWPELNQLQAMFQIGKVAAPSLPADIAPDTVDFLHKTFELDDTLRPTAAELLKHPFIVDDSPVQISAAAAQATMNNVMAARSAPSMQSLSALAEAR